jgi:hypothetical protein
VSTPPQPPAPPSPMPWISDWYHPGPVLCDYCGGRRSTGLTSKGKEVCEDCINGTHAFPPIPGRRCENPACRRRLPPRWIAVYCSVPCAVEDN